MLVMVYGATPETLEARCLTLREQLRLGSRNCTSQPAGRLQIDGEMTFKTLGFLDGLTNPDAPECPATMALRGPRTSAIPMVRTISQDPAGDSFSVTRARGRARTHGAAAPSYS